ncbi:NADH-ubiquinone oxidoreductase subunit NDUFA12 family protein [Rickettsia typhi]|uniref:Uncharacterized protein n=2 Tax=Rickettsia typhi TaxID=785 RepID=Q68W21_RICTY|nr:NADH-ubiquinone oxidoreductase subunit NDUFA12 family protein [Rickettsia typhi]AAU04171.1 conserved hypothetical protein [Rickettsia typhi str. Wilmington]AFE54549.1 hypothetical protein RTTH1527_03420 [Rickettsia typhi str. TH1527]AFE55387.1 hypothetical protein RTB9991CWPP_03420 [Rickettsia typhi str. B9991CWPP]
MSWIDKFFITFFYTKVGEDEFLNQYYESKNNIDYLGRSRRCVIYKNINESTKIPPSWYAWLHHLVNEIPKNVQLFPWQQNKKIVKKLPKTSNLKYNRWQP